jgi:hypothetical protein
VTSQIYPLIVIADRYTGVYSKAKYTAWNHYLEEIPSEIESDNDWECYDFWKEKAVNFRVGLGDTIDEAIADLVRRFGDTVFLKMA